MKLGAALVIAAAAGSALAACERSPPAATKAHSRTSLPAERGPRTPAPAIHRAEPAATPAATKTPDAAIAPAKGAAAPIKMALAAPIAAPTAGERGAEPPPPTSASPDSRPTPGGNAPSRPAPLKSFVPRNECATLAGFPAFRSKLAAAVRVRDADAVAALADPAVKLDFGGGAGRDELRRRLAQTRPELWTQLGEILRLGCAADDGLATMPWIFSRMPDTINAYDTLLAMGEAVPLRERPSADAPVRGELNWALVSPVSERADPKARFIEVESANRTLRGFVERAQLRSLLDYRIIAEKQGDAWAITAFIAGD